jgi:hypothetical protein
MKSRRDPINYAFPACPKTSLLGMCSDRAASQNFCQDNFLVSMHQLLILYPCHTLLLKVELSCLFFPLLQRIVKTPTYPMCLNLLYDREHSRTTNLAS